MKVEISKDDLFFWKCWGWVGIIKTIVDLLAWALKGLV